MVEGQEGVTWPQWRSLADAAETAGLHALFRSDHYGSLAGEAEAGSLDALATMAALGVVTRELRLGTLVSPATFRHPSVTARSAVTADHVSGGRFELGLGAGWNVREHEAYGFPFPPTRERFDILEEQLQIVRGQWEQDPFSFEGRHYRLVEARAEPKPLQAPLPIIVGGGAGPRLLGLAARYADEYNTIFISPEDARERWLRVEEACRQAGRDPATLRYSLMLPAIVGRTAAELRERAAKVARSRGQDDPEGVLAEVAASGVAATVDEAADRLRRYADAGVDRVMLQHQDHTDVEMVALLGDVAPAVA
jgi:F420-dependent oxidoreductase-like protein